MSLVPHKVILRNDQHFGRKLPPQYLGNFFSELPAAIRASVSMAFRNRSQVQGRHPLWLDRTSDIRFLGHEGNGESILYFEAPRLGDAAPELYEQQWLLPEAENRPDQSDTAFDLFGDILGDVERNDADSTRFDPMLLRRISKFSRVFNKSPFTEIDFSSRRFPPESPVRMTPDLVESANALLEKTPSPRRIRIVGQLDGLVASTQRFTLLLDTGEKVSGVFADNQMDDLNSLWRRRVLVLGTAIYRASGKLLRIEADVIKSGDGEPKFFSRMPSPPGTKLDISKFRKPQGPRSGISAIIGKWPGDESEEEITAILEELS